MQEGIRVKFKIIMFTEHLLTIQGDQRTVIHLLLYLVELLINEMDVKWKGRLLHRA